MKWAGGKRQLLAELRRFVPERFGRYYEPFVGGGALFFALGPARATLSDDNERLVHTYLGVKRDVDAVIAKLRVHKERHSESYYYRMRTLDVEAMKDDAERAAWLIYLNKTGYNGLYRVNSRNQFNVPLGRYVDPSICDEPNLRACAAALRRATVRCEDFAQAVRSAREGDFVYFDPPYVPLTTTSSFTSYTSKGFGPPEQQRLRDVALALKKRGVRVLLSNSAAPAVRELYARDFELEIVHAERKVNSRADGRGRIAEYVIH